MSLQVGDLFDGINQLDRVADVVVTDLNFLVTQCSVDMHCLSLEEPFEDTRNIPQLEALCAVGFKDGLYKVGKAGLTIAMAGALFAGIKKVEGKRPKRQLPKDLVQREQRRL